MLNSAASIVLTVASLGSINVNPAESLKFEREFISVYETTDFSSQISVTDVSILYNVSMWIFTNLDVSYISSKPLLLCVFLNVFQLYIMHCAYLRHSLFVTPFSVHLFSE